jgi:glyoxylase I family protein
MDRVVLRRSAGPAVGRDAARCARGPAPAGPGGRAGAVVTAFAGIDHLALSVTDLDVSERFYTGVLGLDRLVDFGEVRILIDRPSSFTVSLSRHADRRPGPFSELTVGLDHVGLTAASREDLVEWADRFRAAGVPFTPIRDMPFGSHLNFRDPDGIALEFFVPNDVLTDSLREVRERDVSQEEIRARVEQVLAGGSAPG